MLFTNKPLYIYLTTLNALRIKEITLMTGFSLVGILFTNSNEWFNLVLNIKIFSFILLYVMAVFFLNSYAGHKHDLESDRLKITTKVPKNIYLYLLITSTILFSVISWSINIKLFYLCICSLLLWALYYFPPTHLKSRFFGGTVAHFIGGVLHFHMGFMSFDNMSLYSLAVSIFFSLLLCVGHFNHEILDYKSDKISGIKTTTVRIGIKGGYYLRTLFIMLSMIHLGLLYYYDNIKTDMFAIFGITVIILLATSLLLKENHPEKFLKISRTTVFIACLVFLLIICR